MPERERTDPNQPVIVNVGKSQSQRNGITVAMIGGIVGLLVAGVGFFSTYIFVTKAELSIHKEAANGGIRKVEDTINDLKTKQALTDAAVTKLGEDFKELKIEQRQANANLNKLVRRRGMIPVSRESIRIKIEGEGDP